MKHLLIVILFCLALGVEAQNQHGYVKTRGRLASNGSVIAGSRLPQATVKLQGGNAVVTGNNGTFTLKLPSGKFFLENVQKKGYVLCDPEALGKQYSYSANDLVLVMEDEQQRLADINAAQKKLRRTLTAQLQKREDEIEALKISNEEKQQMLNRLYDEQTKNEKLIKDMAERYHFSKAEQMFLKALETYQQLAQSNPHVYELDVAMGERNLALCLNQMAYQYANDKDFGKAIAAINEAIGYNSDNAEYYDTKGEILLMQGKEKEALEMWHKVLELNPEFLNDYPDGTGLSNGLKEHGLID